MTYIKIMNNTMKTKSLTLIKKKENIIDIKKGIIESENV